MLFKSYFSIVTASGPDCLAGMGSNGVTVTKLLQLLMILQLYLELNYVFSQIYIVVTVAEVTKVHKFQVTKFLFKSNCPIPAA